MADILFKGFLLLLSVSIVQGQGVQPNGGNTEFRYSLTTEFPVYNSSQQTIVVLFSAAAPQKQDQSARLSITAVLDSSNSTSGQRMKVLKSSMKWIIGKLAEFDGNHSLGAVRFRNRATVLFNVTPVNQNNSNDLVKTIDTKLIGKWHTNLEEGLLTGLEQQLANGSANKTVQTVFFFTDGQPDVRGDSAQNTTKFVEEVRKQFEKARTKQDKLPNRAPISLYTFGLVNPKRELLRSLADIGHGTNVLLNKPNQITKFFGAEMGGLLSVTALELQFMFEAVNGSRIEDVTTGWQKEVLKEGEAVNVTMQNLFLQERRDVLVKLKIPAGSTDQVFLKVTPSTTDAVTFAPDNDEVLYLEVRREAITDDEVANESVEIVRMRFDVCEAAKKASCSGTPCEFDEETAGREIENARSALRRSPHHGSPEIGHIDNDLQELKRLLNRRKAEAASIVSIFVDTLCQQRPPLCGKFFKSVELTEAQNKCCNILPGPDTPEAHPGIDVTFSATPTNESVGMGEQNVTVNVIANASAVTDEETRASIISVIDVAESMGDDVGFGISKLDFVKTVNKRLVDQLLENGERHSLGLVSFDDKAVVRIPAEQVNETSVDDIKEEIDRLSLGRGRNLTAGVMNGLSTALQSGQRFLKALFLFVEISIGLNGGSEIDMDELCRVVQEFFRTRRFSRIAIHIFGLAPQTDALTNCVEQLPELKGNGQMHNLVNLSDLAMVAGEALNDVLSTVADAVSVQLVPENNATIVDVRGDFRPLPKTHDGQGRIVYFNNLGRGEKSFADVKLRLPPGIKEQVFLKVTGRYKDVVSTFRAVTKPEIDVKIGREKCPECKEVPVLAVDVRPEKEILSEESQVVNVYFRAIAPASQNGTATVWITCAIDAPLFTNSLMGAVKESLQMLASKLSQDGADNRLGLLTFHGRDARVDRELEDMRGGNVDAVNEKILEMGEGDVEGADLCTSIMASHEDLKHSEAVHAVIFFTDQTDKSVSQRCKDLDLNTTLRDPKVPLIKHIFYLGNDSTPSTGGHEHFISSPSEVSPQIQTVLDSLLSAFALRVNVTFRPTNGSGIKDIKSDSGFCSKSDGPKNQGSCTLTNMALGTQLNVTLQLLLPSGFNRHMYLEVRTEYTTAVALNTAMADVLNVTISRTGSSPLCPDSGTPGPTPCFCLLADIVEATVETASRR